MTCEFLENCPNDAVVLILPRGCDAPARACVGCWAMWETYGKKSDRVAPVDAGGFERHRFRRNRELRRDRLKGID